MFVQRISRIRLASWHLGILIVVTFLSFSVRQHRLESTDPEKAGQTVFGIAEKTFFDWRLRIRGTRPMSGKVGILAIDEKSIAKFGRWPFPRSTYAPAFKNLKTAGVKWLGLDVMFTEPENLLFEDALEPMDSVIQNSLSPSGVLDPRKFAAGIRRILAQSPGDASLGAALKGFGNVVQAVAFVPPDEGAAIERDWKLALKTLQGSFAQVVMRKGNFFSEKSDNVFPLINTSLIGGEKPIIGSINNFPDNDGIMRVANLVEEIPFPTTNPNPLDKRFMPSLSLQLAAKYLGRKIVVHHSDVVEKIFLFDSNDKGYEIPLTRGSGSLLLNHYGIHDDGKSAPSPVRISLADAVENNLPKAMPDILILGTTTLGIDDKRPSPLNAFANGVEHHVAAVENIIQNDFLRRPPHFLIPELGLLALTGILLCILLSQSSALYTVVFLIVTHVAIEFIDQKFFFGKGKMLNLSILHLQNFSVFLVMILFKYVVEEKEKRKVKGAFQHYLNPSVINQLLESPDGLKLGGEKRELTVFFSDVRGFTTISERLSPESLASLLNEYFTPMTDIVLDSAGLLDKYIGDALMAVWGAPLPVHDHADRALLSSLRMLDTLEKLREGWKARQLPSIDIGCGINTGPMIVGNMGSNQRFDYTVLGDAVNLGARLEGITKEYGVRIICSEYTRKSLRNPDQFLLRELDWIKVKGKDEPVTIYEVMRFSPENKEKTLQLIELFEDGLRNYREGNFEDAQVKMLLILQKWPEDGPAVVFLERCEYFSANPPPEQWDRIWVMKSK